MSTSSTGARLRVAALAPLSLTRLSRLAASLVLCLLAAAPARAADARVKVTAALRSPTVEAGEGVDVTFHLEVPKGQHVYPPGSSDGFALEAKLAGDAAGLTPGSLAPSIQPKKISVEGVGKVAVLEGTFDVVWHLTAAGDAAPGKRQLKLTFTHQACDEKACFPPQDTDFTLELEVLPAVQIGPPLELPPARPAHAGFALVPDRAKPGELVKVTADIFIQPGYHIYAPGSEAGRPTRFEVQAPAGWTAEGDLVAPPPTREEDDKDLGHSKLWENRATLARTFRVPANATPGDVKLEASADWLVCDAKGCVPGKDKLELTLVVLGPNATATATPAPGSSPTVSASPATPAPAESAIGFGALVATAVSAGIVMLFLPCTYPMIPVTISIFSKGKKLPPAQTWARAGTYAAGIIISFTLVGGVVQAILGARGQNFVRSVATNGPLNLVIGALFVYFGLSFFGYYDIGVPQFLNDLVNKALKSARGKPGEGGGVPTFALFLMGFFFVVTSYTCGAPIVLAVITAGAAVPGKVTVIAATAIFGATIALPFFCLALVPGALQALPRGGHWFHTFKVVLGTVEVAAALKFLSNADLYWRVGILTRPVFLSLWVAAAIFAALYVAGVVRFGHEEGPQPDDKGELPPKVSLKAVAQSVPFLIFAIYLGAGLNGRLPHSGSAFLDDKVVDPLEAFLPPEPYPGKEKKGETAKGHIPPYESFDGALAAAKVAGKPLFLEFTGHT